MTNEKALKQSKQYEKERRDRLNSAFHKLSSLLPDYDPVNSFSKVDILTKAFDYIQKLEAEKRNSAETVGKSCEKENLCLKAKVKHLSSRIRQLMDIMYSAKIEIPENLPPTSTYTPLNHCKWNGKAGDKKVELLLKRICDKNKENKKNKQKSKEPHAAKNKQVLSQAKNQSRTTKIYHQKKRVIRLVRNEDTLGSLSSISNVVLSIADINATVVESPSKSTCPSTVVPLQENNSKNKIISINSSTAEIKNCLAQSNKSVSLINTPIMATGITSPLSIQNVVQNVNLGTYILPNGQLMAVQQQGAIIPQITPQILINRPITPVLVMQNSNSINEKPSIIIKNNNLSCEPFVNNCRPIYPKRKREITRTTFSSQKPIPSLNLNFSGAKYSKQIKTETLNVRKQKPASKKNLMSSSVKKLMKNDIKKRNGWKGKKDKVDKEITLLKTKRLERISLKRNKLLKRTKTKYQKNKFTNCTKVPNSLLIKKTGALNGCDIIRSKKVNLGSITRTDKISNEKNAENLNGDRTLSMNAEIGIQSSTNFASTSESSDFSSPSKNLTSESLNLKDTVFSDTNFNKSLEPAVGEKVSNDAQIKLNTSIVEASVISQISCYSTQNTSNSFGLDPKLVDPFSLNSSKDVLNQLGTYEKNSFLPILPPYLEDVREFPPDILSSLQIPSNLHNSESLSPTAAFLLSFPLVSTSKNSELLNENELSCESQNDNSTSILQIGNIESPSSSLIEGQAVLFDQQYTQLSKSHWLPKSCDKIESNQKYNDSLGINFVNSNTDSVHAPNSLNKKCPEFSDSSCKVENLKNKNISSAGSNHPFTKNPSNTMDKVLFEKKSNFATILGNSETVKQHTSSNFSASSHDSVPCSTKENSKTTPSVCNNLLPMFSELYSAKTEKPKMSNSSSKSNERLCENAKKIKDKEKIKGSTVNPESLELNSCDTDLNVVKNDAKTCKDKVCSVSIENTPGNTKSLVNWMTAPDVRSHSIEQFSIPELFATQNFDFLATSSVSANSYSVSFAPSNIDQLFEYSSTIDNNKLYNPNYPVVLNQTNVWSPSKSSLSHHSVGPHLDSNNFIIPSTLPTLIGDLALGTSTTPIVDAFKTASFEMIPDNFAGQRMGDLLANDSQKSSERATQDHKTGAVINETPTGTRCKAKESVEELSSPEKKDISDNSRNRQPNKMLPFKKPDVNDKSQQTSAVNFLSVSQLVDQNQVKSSVSGEIQYPVNSKRSNISRQKQPNKNPCNFFNNETGSEKQAVNKNRPPKKETCSSSNNGNESIDTENNQKPYNQTLTGNKIDNSSSTNSWYQNQNQKEQSSLETNTKSNNYSAESLLNTGNCHAQVINYNPLTELHIPQNCSPEKSGKLHSSCVSNYFIPPSQPYHGNIQQVANVIQPSNTLGESLQFSNQNYLPEANIGYEKTSSGYYSFVPSSQTCHVSAKNVSNSKQELNKNCYSSTSLKNSKEKRPSCKQGIDGKNLMSNVELNHGINSYITPPFSRSLLTSTLSTSNYLFTDPVYTNTQSSLHTNKVDNMSTQYSNENFLKPCVSISDYAPFDDCNFKTAKNPLSITNTLAPPSTSNSSLYMPHTALPCNALATNFKNNPANFPNFLTPVVSSNSSSLSSNNPLNCAPSVCSSSTSVSLRMNNSNFPPSSVSSSAVIVSSSSTVSNYLPTFIGSTTSLTSTVGNFSDYLSPIISTAKSSKKASSCSIPKSITSTSIANYLPPIIPTTSITSGNGKISSYLAPAISTSSLAFTQSNSISNYLPSIIPSTSSSGASETCITSYLPPVISSSNALGNADVSNYLPPVLPALNDSSLYLPLNNTCISSTASSISAQYLHPPSVSYVTSTTTNAKTQSSSATYLPYSSAASTNRDNSSSFQNKYVPSSSHGNTPSYQPYTSSVSTVNAAVNNNSSSHLPIFSSKTSNPVIVSSYMPVFSNSSNVSSSSSSYLPIFSSSSSDLTIISSNYPPLPNGSQGHNSFPSLNTSYTSNYLPPSSLPSSNYFPVTLNSAVSSNSLVSNSTPNYVPTATPFSAANASFSVSSVPASSHVSASSSVPSRSSNKSCKTSPSSCKNYISAKPTNTSAETSNSESKKQQSNSKPNQNDVNSKSNTKVNTSAAGTQFKSFNPCGAKFSNSLNANSRSNKSIASEVLSSSACKQPTQFEMPKLPFHQQTNGGNFEIERPSTSFVNNSKVPNKANSLPAIFSISSGNTASNNFNCIYSTSDSISYQPVNFPNTFQNRPEFMDPASVCPLPSFSNDVITYSIKNGPTSQKYVPPNEQLVYNTGSNSGSSSLTNFNLCAILPEMNEKLRCHNTINNSFSAQGVPEQPPFGKYDFYQYPEKKHQTSPDKKGQQMQHIGQNIPVNRPHINNTKPTSSLYQNNMEAS